ncbi:unnamed protein product [Microthlaspi erraticum]|uniref:holo-[acyl-carrier-protein] synthase n=1 Tax=Microthlaspi erraticum TaxID=1685480 RepID=A0A6D2HUF9_9BRAS|nr:unnamed protein product [Microthlaspi erraticum]
MFPNSQFEPNSAFSGGGLMSSQPSQAYETSSSTAKGIVPVTVKQTTESSQSGDTEAQRKEFIKLWTLKEAYVKALGKGFSASPFNTFSIIQTEESYNLCQAEERVGEWKFKLLEFAASSHYAAICIEDDDEANDCPQNHSFVRR